MHQECTNPSPSTFPISLSDLQFPSNAHNFSSTLSALKRSTLSIGNRLRSIRHDSEYVQATAAEHDLPLVANERCGSWYIPPAKKAGSAYFKSTDGHFGEWAFSRRRLNLQVLEIIGVAGGCVIVDSTRRGKSMPDALSKTVPIWCVVLNRLLFPERYDMHELHTPRTSVGQSEHAQMVARIDAFVQDAKLLQMDIPLLQARVKRPLVPCWITPHSEDLSTGHELQDYNRVVCCTASRRVNGTEASENGYIQGAADDHEGWSSGLTPALFWQHEVELLSLSDEAIPDFIWEWAQAETTITMNDDHAIELADTRISLGNLSAVEQSSLYDAVVSISGESPDSIAANEPESLESKTVLRIPCKPGKLGSRSLRYQLHPIFSFLSPYYSADKAPRILIACPDTEDFSIGVALAILCKFYDDQNKVRSIPSSTNIIDKDLIRRRLAQITMAKPDASLSRATLQSVNAVLMPQV